VIFGYARISTFDQNLDLQKDALKKAGCEKIFVDQASGAKTDRPGLSELLEKLRSGDTLVVWKLDRLGRSMQHLIETVNMLEKMGVAFKSLMESIDTTTINGKLVFHIFGALAEFERGLISERTRAGLEAARARGRIGGRKKGLTEKARLIAVTAKALYENSEENKMSTQDIADRLGISRPTLYKYLRLEGAAIGKYERKGEK
jgi:DNA invertase Pin-like site-specific DNA recombinase